ncbi:hypothetical protein [Rhizorhabdus wittichii]|uniref:hypothetical protein n=1 Tax=Rhizorhabdus wittichii TaxID=160791 RepID=UPI001D02C1A9|nr:hypothetical protein [Rhizorhabdus wittichii]
MTTISVPSTSAVDTSAGVAVVCPWANDAQDAPNKTSNFDVAFFERSRCVTAFLPELFNFQTPHSGRRYHLSIARRGARLAAGIALSSPANGALKSWTSRAANSIIAAAMPSIQFAQLSCGPGDIGDP